MEWVTEARLHGWGVLWSVLDASLKVLVLAGCAAFVCRLNALRKASLQHVIWTAVAMGMWLLPILSLLVTPVARAPIPIEMTAVGPITPEINLWSAWPGFLLALYLTVAAVLLSRLALGIFMSRRLSRTSRTIEDGHLEPAPRSWARDISVRACSAVAVPVTLGLLRPVILLPESWTAWSSATLRAVMEHELAHIRRLDYGVHLFSRAVQCLYWFHPVAWFLPRRLSALAERSCDDVVVHRLGDPHRYARDLLELAAGLEGRRSRLAPDVLAVLEPSSLERRIDELLDVRNHRSRARPESLLARALLVACGAVLTLAASSARLQGRAVWTKPAAATVTSSRSDSSAGFRSGSEHRRCSKRTSHRHVRKGSQYRRHDADREVRRRMH